MGEVGRLCLSLSIWLAIMALFTSLLPWAYTRSFPLSFTHACSHYKLKGPQNYPEKRGQGKQQAYCEMTRKRGYTRSKLNEKLGVIGLIFYHTTS